ncbi:hypothetical protein B0H11DRAFT_2108369 [Mycena galericulata]|nr:hypothetical protein B0H11DRAFT_2108369 [Mycena galericulata]
MFDPRSRALYLRRCIGICICVVVATTIVYTDPMKSLSSRTIDYTSLSEPLDNLAPANIISPTLYPTQIRTWITENQKNTIALFKCIGQQSSCGQNQTKVVIIVAADFIGAMEGGHIGGEAISAFSTRRALDNMGYSVLFAPNLERAVQLYHIFDNLVKMVIMDAGQTDDCWFSHGSCRRTDENPTGIPVWKIFTFHFWIDARNPLGEKWTLSPEPYQPFGRAPNTFLGYSIEAQCRMHRFIPHSERNPQAYILAKFLQFFRPDGRAWPPEFFDLASNSTGLSFLIGARENDSPLLLAASIKNLGPLKQDDFYGVLSKSVVLIGMGDPVTSPTPYDALCLGVPFINPIRQWDAKNPDKRSKWHTQHDMLKHLSPPYVYNVFKDDREGFLQAIRDAQAHPIESLVLDRMKMESVEHRLGAILEHDWRSEAADLLQKKKGMEQDPLFIL